MREFSNENMKVKFLGDISSFSKDIQDLIKTIEFETKDRTGLNLNIAMNYGSRNEITNAVKKIAEKISVKNGDILLSIEASASTRRSIA